jgi:hypothetical protein
MDSSSAPLLASLRTFTPNDEMPDEGALAVTLHIVAYPLGNETSQRADSRMTCTDTRFCADLVHAMASSILITMFHNLAAKIEYSSLVMRQVPSVSKDNSIRDTAAALKTAPWGRRSLG